MIYSALTIVLVLLAVGGIIVEILCSFAEKRTRTMRQIMASKKPGAEDWKALIVRFAAGRQVCNCGEAYYTPCGEGIAASGQARKDLLVCQYGCSTNKLIAKYDIAERLSL